MEPLVWFSSKLVFSQWVRLQKRFSQWILPTAFFFTYHLTWQMIYKRKGSLFSTLLVRRIYHLPTSELEEKISIGYVLYNWMSELEEKISIGYVLYNWMSKFITEMLNFNPHTTVHYYVRQHVFLHFLYLQNQNINTPTSTPQSLFVHYYRQLHLTLQRNLLPPSE
jgi:hypothetical protein